MTPEIIHIIKDFVFSLSKALLVFVVGWWLISQISRLAGKAMERRNFEISLKTFLRSLITVALRVLLIVQVAGILGIGTTSFVAILGAAGLAVGLALQGSLANFAGGMLILLFKPYKVGDVIEAGGHIGKVLEIQIFNTIMLTADHKTIILPNGAVSNHTIVNYTQSGDLRVDIQLAFGIETDVAEIRPLLLNHLTGIKEIHAQPQPTFHIQSIGPGDIQCVLQFFCDPSVTAELKTQIQEDILKIFRDKEIALDDDAERLVVVRSASEASASAH